jgi:hypothetical protein
MENQTFLYSTYGLLCYIRYPIKITKCVNATCDIPNGTVGPDGNVILTGCLDYPINGTTIVSGNFITDKITKSNIYSLYSKTYNLIGESITDFIKTLSKRQFKTEIKNGDWSWEDNEYHDYRDNYTIRVTKKIADESVILDKQVCPYYRVFGDSNHRLFDRFKFIYQLTIEPFDKDTDNDNIELIANGYRYPIDKLYTMDISRYDGVGLIYGKKINYRVVIVGTLL